MTMAQTFTDLQATPLDEGAVGELLTVQDAARFLNVSVSWVYEHVRDDSKDRLPVLKLGKYLRFDQSDLRAYIDATREAGPPLRGSGCRPVALFRTRKKEFKNGRC